MTAAFALAFAIYCVLAESAVWLVMVPATLVRVAAGRATLRELRDRLGMAPATAPGGVLVHAVSAGEMRAVSTLVAHAWPEQTLILTTGTSAGMAVATELRRDHSDVVATMRLPWDRWAIRSWLRTMDVSLVVVSETEIWPGLFLACRALGIPLFIVNGRLRHSVLRRYRLASWFFRPVLACATWIGTQDASHRDAFMAIGAPADRVEVAGDLKADIPPARGSLPAVVVDEFRGGPILVAGSTHAPEEAWLAPQMSLLKQQYGLRMVIAPRDVGRSAEVSRIMADCRLSVVTWSALSQRATAAHDWDVLVVDQFGWLARLYASATVVFLGGTVAPVGGHNILEATTQAKPVIIGPYVESIEPWVRRMKAEAGVVCLPSPVKADALAEACADLLDRPVHAAAVGDAGRRAGEQTRGVTDRYAQAMRDRSHAVVVERRTDRGLSRQ